MRPSQATQGFAPRPQEQERKQLAEQQKARRDELMRGNWKGKGEVLNAMRSVIQAAIEGAIRQCAPATRQKDEGRDWNDYTQRTARYAYSAVGDRQAADLGKYRQQWEKLKGREPVRQQEQAKAQKIERDNSPELSL